MSTQSAGYDQLCDGYGKGGRRFRVVRRGQETIPMPVTRCVCHDVTFAELKVLSDVVDADIDALAARTGCGTGCGTCIPYIQLMLRTGLTELPVFSGAQIRDALQRTATMPLRKPIAPPLAE